MRTKQVWDGSADIAYCADNSRYLHINSCSMDSYRLQSVDDFVLDRIRTDWYLIYFTGGTAFAYLDGKKYSVNAGDILLFEPGTPQRILRRREDASSDYYVHFTGYAVREMLSDCGLCKSGIYSFGENPLIKDTFVHLIVAFTLGNDISYVNYLFTKLLMHIGGNLEGAASRIPITDTFDNKIIMGLMRLDWEVSQNGNPDVKRYADMSGYGMSQFVRSFKNTAGKTPTRYQIDARIARAKELLLTSSLSVAQISSLAGYNDPLYFSRIFRKRTGMSPREYRKMGEGEKGGE